MKGIHPEAIEKEAFLALKKLGRTPLFPRYYLGGGTGLTLQLGHRISKDLDFFSPKPLPNRQLVSTLRKLGKFSVRSQAEETLHGTLGTTKVSFLGYRYPLLKKAVTFEGVPLAPSLDLGCMKLEAIATRGHKRDFIDVYEVIKHGPTLAELIKLFKEKYKAVNYNPSHLLKSLTYFADAEEEPDPHLLHKEITWEKAKEFFEEEAPKILKMG